MITTNYKYSPSVNIVNDLKANLNYIPTANAKLVYNTIVDNFDSGIRSFNIVGAYGTGKSAFLLAFEKTLNKKQAYFKAPAGKLSVYQEFKVLPIVGKFESLLDSIANALEIDLSKGNNRLESLFVKLDSISQELAQVNQALIIAIDEFGKHLEFAASNNPEQELYFIQQLAEYVNDLDRNIILITSLHQDFSAYSHSLTRAQRQEWDKVKGRLKELTFNEPVEQLLYLASERLKEKPTPFETYSGFDTLFDSIKEANTFPLKDYFNKEVASKLLPFDILSAAILTLSLQKYGQNERSLFSFIDSENYLGLTDYDTASNPFYNISCVYDYLSYNFHSYLLTSYNTDHSKWYAIKIALERAESLNEQIIAPALKLIKTIGLLNIFSSAAAKINFDFLSSYGEISLGISNTADLIDSLESAKIIRYRNYSSKYILFEGTDINIEEELLSAEEAIPQVDNITSVLNEEYFKLPYIAAKEVQYKLGTPRYFQLKLTESPITTVPEGEVDGYINLIFGDTSTEAVVQQTSAKSKEAIIYGFYSNSKDIRAIVYEIKKIKYVLERHQGDNVVVKELEEMLSHKEHLLNQYILTNLYDLNSPIRWYIQGEDRVIESRRSFNRVLSELCHTIYYNTPKFSNELVNKTKLSSAIATARKSLIEALVQCYTERDLGFEENKFPPQKTVYLSLLRETGIHKQENNYWILDAPVESSFLPLWKASEDFINKTKEGSRSIQELINLLSVRPFKLKKGFIDFWVPIFIFIKRNDFALFDKAGIYIPVLNDSTLELIVKNPADYTIKGFSIDGVRLDLFNKYRNLLNQTHLDILTNQSFIETIKPFLSFYKDLPDYAKKTKKVTIQTQKLRGAIAEAKDPERAFFEDFPRALGFSIQHLQSNESDLAEYTNYLQECIRELRSSVEKLTDRFEEFIKQEFIGEDLSFDEYKKRIKNRFDKVKPHSLGSFHKTLHLRLCSDLDERQPWLNSIAQAIIGKRLDTFNDVDETVLYDRIKTAFSELDNLSEISVEDIDDSKEEVLKLTISSFVEGVDKIVRLPKKKSDAAFKTEEELKKLLTNDKELNIIILTHLLKEQLKNG
jgi:hypothetical protein